MLGDGLPEDERTWAFDFRVMTPTAWWRVPMQTLVAGLPTDATAQYRIHRMMLQQFQFDRPTKYWVLKGFHGFRLRGVLRRLSGRQTRLAAPRSGTGGGIAHHDDGRHHGRHRRARSTCKAAAKMHLELTRASIANTMSNPLTDDPRIHHVRYTDFVADQIATIRGYYAFSGRELTPEAEAAMRNYLAQQQGRPPRQVPLLDQPC